MTAFSNKLRESWLLRRLFHTLEYCLREELKDCESVLDLGCGPSSPLQYCPYVTYSLGVEAFKPYLEASRIKKIHSEYQYAKLEDINFSEHSFDAVILIEVLEHLPKDVGLEMLRRAKKWAKIKVIATTPNGYFPMGDVDGNEHQRHLSGWDVEELEKLGFQSHGLSGAKILYSSANQVESLIHCDSLGSNIRVRPKILGYALATLSQFFTYHAPQWAFGTFNVLYKQKSEMSDA